MRLGPDIRLGPGMRRGLERRQGGRALDLNDA
jgi:hypothetical protein